jgi:hypothetical protein
MRFFKAEDRTKEREMVSSYSPEILRTKMDEENSIENLPVL